MKRRIKYFIHAIFNIVNNEDYLRYITDGMMSYDDIGEYLSMGNDKNNLKKDFLNFYSDMGKAVQEAHGKCTNNR